MNPFKVPSTWFIIQRFKSSSTLLSLVLNNKCNATCAKFCFLWELLLPAGDAPDMKSDQSFNMIPLCTCKCTCIMNPNQWNCIISTLWIQTQDGFYPRPICDETLILQKLVPPFHLSRNKRGAILLATVVGKTMIDWRLEIPVSSAGGL